MTYYVIRGESIISDSSGKLKNKFSLPSGKYHNGEHLFRLQDSLDILMRLLLCESKYTANGLKNKQKTRYHYFNKRTCISYGYN